MLLFSKACKVHHQWCSAYTKSKNLKGYCSTTTVTKELLDEHNNCKFSTNFQNYRISNKIHFRSHLLASYVYQFLFAACLWGKGCAVKPSTEKLSWMSFFWAYLYCCETSHTSLSMYWHFLSNPQPGLLCISRIYKYNKCLLHGHFNQISACVHNWNLSFL